MISTSIFGLNMIMSDTSGLAPEQIIKLFEERYSDHDGLNILRTVLPDTWKDWVKKGLFADIEGWDSCTIRLGRGKGLGSEKASYLPEATLVRLDYILECTQEGLTAEQIRIALTQKILKLGLHECITPWNFKVSLTRPLLLVLGSEKPWALEASAVHQELWAWNPATQAAWRASEQAGRDPAKDLLNRRARYHLPLGLWIEPPRSPEWFIDEWLALGEQGVREITDAIRRVVTGSRVPESSRRILEQHAQKDYKIEVKSFSPTRTAGNPPTLYQFAVTPDRDLTLLKQVTAHALQIGREPEQWVRKCARRECDRLLFLDDPRRKFCGAHQR